MELYLIRHGQSAHNENPSVRMTDPPLTALGERQALCAGRALADKRIVRLYCSPFLRAMQTAQIMSEPLGLHPHVFVGLHEWYNEWVASNPGLTRQQMEDVCPGVVLPEDVTDQGWLFRTWVGDNAMLDQIGRNVQGFLSHLAEQHAEPNERVAAVSHGGCLSTLFGACYGLEPVDDPDRFAHQNAAISKIRRNGEVTQTRYSNRLSHLSDEMITW